MSPAPPSGLGRGSLALRIAADGADAGVDFVNAGVSPLRLWSRGCALGWDTVTLLAAADPGGDDVVRLTPPPRNWTRDGPIPLDVPPGARVTLASWPGEPAWQGLAQLHRWRNARLAVRAELRIEASAEAAQAGVASGALRSPVAWSPAGHAWLLGGLASP